MRRLIFGLGLALAACAAPVDTVDTARTVAGVVYGADDRRELFEVEPELASIARGASVALFDEGALVPEGERYALPLTFTLEEAEGLCATERFLDQPTAATCSGTLIAPAVVLTAGHCVPDADACAATAFVFDYLYEAPGALAAIDEADVYHCGALLLQRLDAAEDFALVRLDRPVVGRAPAGVNARAQDPLGSGLTVLGYGSGLPLKVDSGGAVVGHAGEGAFMASTDSFTGHSGGSVLDPAGALVGVLVSGAEDYVRQGDCFVVDTRPSEEGAERVQRVEVPLRRWCAVEPDSELCASLPADGVSGRGCAIAGAPRSSDTPGFWVLALFALVGLRAVARAVPRSSGSVTSAAAPSRPRPGGTCGRSPPTAPHPRLRRTRRAAA